MVSLKRWIKGTRLYAAYRARRLRREITGWGAIDAARLALYRQLATAGELCFDVGANVGNRAKIMLRLGCRVVAVEPQPECQAVLRRFFASAPGFVLEAVALGADEGQAEMHVGTESTVSSLAPEWIETVVGSGRFSPELWSGRTITVPVTTLDRLIARHGVPAFIKIDVEGFELQVLQGLSRAPRHLCFEFVPEQMAVVRACIARLRALGEPAFNLSLGESAVFHFERWLAADAFLDALAGGAIPSGAFGDIYARFGPHGG